MLIYLKAAPLGRRLCVYTHVLKMERAEVAVCEAVLTTKSVEALCCTLFAEEPLATPCDAESMASKETGGQQCDHSLYTGIENK